MLLLFFLAPTPVTQCNKLGAFTGSNGIAVKCGKSIVEVCEGSSQSSRWIQLSPDKSWSTVDEAGWGKVYRLHYIQAQNHLLTCICVTLVHSCVHICICVIVPSASFSLQRLTLLHVNSNQCLDMPSEEDKMVPTLRDCSGSHSQQWLLRNMTLSVWSLTSQLSPPPHPPHPPPLRPHINQPRLSTPSPGGCYHAHRLFL